MEWHGGLMQASSVRIQRREWTPPKPSGMRFDVDEFLAYSVFLGRLRLDQNTIQDTLDVSIEAPDTIWTISLDDRDGKALERLHEAGLLLTWN